jgi:hypothetical protein
MELPTLQIRKVREDIICITGGLTYEDIGCYVQRHLLGIRQQPKQKDTHISEQLF